MCLAHNSSGFSRFSFQRYGGKTYGLRRHPVANQKYWPAGEMHPHHHPVLRAVKYPCTCEAEVSFFYFTL